MVERPKPVFYENTEFFNLLVKEASDEKYKDKVHYEYMPQLALMLDYMIYVSDAIRLNINHGHLTVKSRAKSLDISRVWVEPFYHGRGIGTQLVELLLIMIITTVQKNETAFPKVVCECAGVVGGDVNRQETPIELQVRFFQKFGFELTRVDNYDNRHMTLNPYKMEQYFNKKIAEYESKKN